MFCLQESEQAKTTSDSQELGEDAPLDTTGLTPVEDTPLDFSQFGTSVDAEELPDNGQSNLLTDAEFLLDSGQSGLPGYSAVDIVAGTILAYGLPLLAAVVIRFGIRSRPLSKGIAALIAAILWICTYSAFFALHAAAGVAREWTSRPHAALFIAALLAFYVLRAHGRRADEAKSATPETSAAEMSTQPQHRRSWPNRRTVFGVVITLMLLFPPWTSEQVAYSGRAAISRPAGYAFIATPPETYDRSVSIQLDLWRLLVQLGAVAAVWFTIEGSRRLRLDRSSVESQN